ncbi:MAG: gliding motility-associated C-terminal domain-containing protein [Rhizobacter sp.]|nr:gliding motility-associated C-terminal domain-containing protein [Ferruginibacter sp.]
MRKVLPLTFIFFTFLLNNKLYSQGCVPTNLNGTTINLSCGNPCTAIQLQVPHLKSTSSYALTSIPFNPYQYVVTGGTEDPVLYDDDEYSALFTLPFTFCFYDSSYTQAVIGSNGLITFDETNASCDNGFTINPPIPSAGGGTQCAQLSTYYPRASIMAAFSDLDPSPFPVSPTDRLIQWRVEGSAPCRRFIVSYYRVGVFGANTCAIPNPTTFQIVMYESTGLIEVFFENKTCQSSTTSGKAIFGLQNYNRDQAVFHPTRNATVWTAVNEGWRFIPNGGASRFVSAEILNMAGTVLATADTLTTVQGLLDINFPNVCPGPGATQYVVRTTFGSCPTGTTMTSLDTITIQRNNTLPVTTTLVQPTCGSNSGSITINVATGVGTTPYAFSLNGGATQASNVFNGLGAGTYTVFATDATGCDTTYQVTLNAISNLTATTAVTNASCPGVNNGTITVTPTAGVAPFTYTINGSPNPSGVFTNLPAGTYIIIYTDANTCNGSVTLVVGPGTSITATALSNPTSCAGAPNGTITVTPTSGTAPYTYSLDGGTAQTSNVFTGVSGGSHIITILDGAGCTVTITNTVNDGTGLTGAIFQTPVSCPGINDGTISMTNPFGASPGTGPYTYSLDGGPFQPGNTFTGVSAGNHTVTFRDANNCQGIRTITVGGGTVPSTTATSANTSCAGVNNGVIVISPVPGSTYTVNPGAITNTTGTFLGLPAGTYTLSITTAGGCPGTVTPATVVIAAGTGLTGTATTVATSCPGATNGSVTVAPQVAGTIYTLNPGAITNTTGIFTGLGAGTYTATFVTPATCSGTVSPNPVVAAGTAVTTTATAAPTCTGGNSGTITVSPLAAGTTYTLNPGAVTNTTGIFTGLAAGTYIVTFTTPATCTGTISPNPVVTAIPALTASSTNVAATCPGINDGSITVAPVGAGTTYTLNPGAITNTTGIFTGLATGTYTISFATAGGCAGTVSPGPVITAGVAPTSTATSVSTTCPSLNDGVINVAPVGAGTTYTLNPGAVSNTTGIFTGLATGTYTITFVTAVGCNGTVPVNPVVTSGPAPTSTASSTATTCPSLNDGTITVAPVGAGANYTLNPGAISNTTGIFSGLATGTYTVTFVTAAGCNGTVPVNPVVTSGPAPTTTAASAATSCPGVSDGFITVVAVGTGTTYTVNPGGLSNTTGVFTGLAAGSYTVTFVTGAGCNGTVVTNPVVASGPAITGTATVINTSCATVNNGSITVTTPVGTGTSYTLNPGGVTNTTGIFTGLAPNTYTISFLTGAGCTGIVSPNPVVAAGPSLTSTFAQTNPVCNNINDAVITITAQAGTTAPFTATLTGPGGPYTYAGNGPIVFSGLAPGVYNYSYAEAGGCTGTGGPVTLVTNTPIYVPAVLTNLSCNNSANGSVTFNAIGGVAPYQYRRTPTGTFQAGNTFSGLIAGSHSFQIRDNVNCTRDTIIILTQPTVLTAAINGTTPAGCSNNDGSITASATGGTGPYSYSITGATINASGSSTGIFTALANGPYTITVTDAQACTINTTGTVGLTDNMFLSLGPDVTICAESSVTFNPQTNPETNIFTWTAINGTAAGSIANPSIKNAVASPLDTATYVLHAQWGGCERRDTIVVNVLRKPVANAGSDTAICNQTYAILRGSSGNLSGAVNYAWSPAADVEFPAQAVTRVHPPGSDILYRYTLTVTDNYGCNFKVTDEVAVRVQPPVPAFAGNDTTAVRGTPYQLFATGGDDYLWTPSTPLNNAAIQNPRATLPGDQKFIVRVTDFAGCIGYDTVFVKVYAGPAYYIPNAFTPNGDGLNDIFRPVPAGIARTEYFRIFNRYGETIFETSQYLKGWDGTFKGKKQAIGAYVWIIKGVDRNGKTVELKGTVMLVQ